MPTPRHHLPELSEARPSPSMTVAALDLIEGSTATRALGFWVLSCSVMAARSALREARSPCSVCNAV